MQKARNITFVDEGRKEIHLRDKAAMRPFGPFDKVRFFFTVIALDRLHNI